MMYHDLAYAWHRLDGRVQNAKIDPVWRSRASRTAPFVAVRAEEVALAGEPLTE